MLQWHKPECTLFNMSYVIFLASHSVRKVEANKTSSALPNPSCLSLSHPIPPARAAHKSFSSLLLPVSLLFFSDHLLSQFCMLFRLFLPSLFSLSLPHTFLSWIQSWHFDLRWKHFVVIAVGWRISRTDHDLFWNKVMILVGKLV